MKHPKFLIAAALLSIPFFAGLNAQVASAVIVPTWVRGETGTGGEYFSFSAKLLNLGSSAESVTVRVYSDSGQLILDTGNIPYTVAPGSELVLSPAGGHPLETGWMLISSSPNSRVLVEGTVELLRRTGSAEDYGLSSKEQVSNVQVPGVVPRTKFSTPVIIASLRQEVFRVSCIALVNPSPAQTAKVQVTLTGWHPIQQLEGSRDWPPVVVSVPPLGRKSLTLADLYPGVLPAPGPYIGTPAPYMVSGVLTLNSDEPIAANVIDLVLPEGRFQARTLFGE